MQKFQLKRITDIAPGCGEDLGAALITGAGYIASRSTRAQMLYLAAEAYEAGASASIGHNRSARYEEQAGQARRHAAALEAEVKAERDAYTAAAHLAALKVGYEGGDIKRYSFDRRDAALVGQHLAKLGKPMPASVACTRDVSSNREFDVGGERYVVACPTGRGADTTVELAA